MFEAYDSERQTSSGLMGAALPISVATLLAGEASYDVDLYIKYKKTATLKFTAKLIEAAPVLNPALNPNSRLELEITGWKFSEEFNLILA